MSNYFPIKKELYKDRKTRNIVLVGFMGSGKTTVSKILAKKLALGLIDLDKEIEKEQGLEVSQIFLHAGEDFFRDYETKVLKEKRSLDNVVVSLGGGTLEREINLTYAMELGLVYFLDIPFDQIWGRIKDSKDRPLVANDSEEEKIKLSNLYVSRLKNYRKADFILSSEREEPYYIVKQVMEIYNSFN